MRNLALSAGAGALLITASAAFGATDTGIIKNVDPKGDAITLDDGKVFVLAEGTEAESLKVGDKVKVTFKMKSGKLLATKVQIAK
jgi:Cu/Ag efflux protein CusF